MSRLTHALLLSVHFHWINNVYSSLTDVQYHFLIYFKVTWLKKNSDFLKIMHLNMKVLHEVKRENDSHRSHGSARLHHQSLTAITVTWVLTQTTCTSSTQLSQHYLSTHLTSVSCPISHLLYAQLLTSRLLTPCSSLVLRVSYICLSSSVTPAHLRCWSEVCAQPRHPRVPGKKTTISISLTF